MIQTYRQALPHDITLSCRAAGDRGPREGEAGVDAVTLPREMLTVDVPTLVLRAMEDAALLPEPVEDLDDYIPRLTLEKVPGASHWIVHERPAFVAERLTGFLAGLSRRPARPAGVS